MHHHNTPEALNPKPSKVEARKVGNIIIPHGVKHEGSQHESYYGFTTSLPKPGFS